MKKSSGDEWWRCCITILIDSIPLNYTLKNVLNGKFCHVYFLKMVESVQLQMAVKHIT